MPKNQAEDSGPPADSGSGFKKFFRSLSPFRGKKQQQHSDGGGPVNTDHSRGFSFDFASANTSKSAVQVGPAKLTDREMANLERRRKRMSSQAQLGGLSPDTAFSPQTTSTTQRAETRKFEAQGETESINTTRTGHRASRAIVCGTLTFLVLVNILSNASPTPDPSQMTARGKIEKY